MSEYVKMQAKWIRTTGASTDDMTNTLYATSATESLVTIATAMQNNFVNELFQPFAEDYLSEDLFTGAMEFTYWDLTAPVTPFLTGTATFTPAVTAQKVPTDVALCISFQGLKSAGLPQGRRRGRIYLPCPADQIDVSTGLTVWDPTMVTAVAGMAQAAKDAITTDDCFWVVFSPTILAASSDYALATVPVDNGWVDNEPDTQRRRGLRRGTKTTWT